MLSEQQIIRLLVQSEKSWAKTKDPKFEGWIQALRLVLEENTYPIRNTPMGRRATNDLLESLEEPEKEEKDD